jgi:serine/threonine protein kinase
MQRLGDYTVLGRIGMGATAEILLGERGGKRFALKHLHPHLVADADVCASFFDEARLASRLHHERIVAVVDLCEDAGEIFTVLELVDGPSLMAVQKLHARPLPIDACAHVLASVADALAYVHAATDPATQTPLALVHRDVAPANILIARTGEVKLTDFGIARSRAAKQLGIVSADTTRGGVVKGRRAYVSPEQVKGEQLDSRSDLYSLGVIAWELLAGTRMHPDVNALDLIERIVHHAAAPIASLRSDTPLPIAEVVDALLQKDRARRPSSAGEVRAAVSTWRGDRALQPALQDVVTSLGLPSLVLPSLNAK